MQIKYSLSKMVLNKYVGGTLYKRTPGDALVLWRKYYCWYFGQSL